MEASNRFSKAGANQPPLPRTVQEHLGQKLRALLYELSDKPKYLGDPNVPLEFDALLNRIEDKERMQRKLRIEQLGERAVAAALSDFLGYEALAGRAK